MNTTTLASLPLSSEQIAAIATGVDAVNTARAAVQALADNPAFLDALRAWHAATSVNLPEDEFSAMNRSYEDWRDACGITELATATWPLRDVLDVLSLEVEPGAEA